MKTITVKDKKFKLSIKSRNIQKVIQRMADEINKDMVGKVPVFLVVLNGAFVFASDLLKHINVDCEISFVKLSSYSGTKSSHIVKELIGLNEILKDRTVIVVEDIVDTGITMDHMIQHLFKLEARDVRVATLLFKPESFEKEFTIHYKGIEIPNDFIVGYGLDYDGFGRNFPDIYKIID